MASVSLPPAALPSPFDASSPPSTPSRSRRRQPSRNINADTLPKFIFNPGNVEANSRPSPEIFPRSSPGLDENQSDTNTMEGGTRKSRPAPLPSFSFNPGADLPPDPETTPTVTHPVLQEMAMNQQRATRSARPAPLPAFTFNSNSGSAHPSPSPTKSTFGETPLSAGSISLRHRRGGSEFVGGGKEGTQLISTSPEKGDYRPPPVSGHPRGHMHRRSQAISVSDIDTSELIKTAALSKTKAGTGSNPSTPSEAAQHFSFPKGSPPSSSNSPSPGARSPPASPRRRESGSFARPRVGFADRVDVIPRPLSMISSETEGSCSTIRGHSVTGSINSIASPSSRMSIVSSPAQEEVEPKPQRPRTADPATLLFSEVSKVDRPMDMINLPKRPLSASGSPALSGGTSPPTKKKHFWFSPTMNTSPTPTPKTESSDPLETVPMMVSAKPEHCARPKTSPERSSSVRKRKYHTWTSGIFQRKAAKRPGKQKLKRTPTPPTLTRRASDRINEIFDEDSTVVLREPSPIVQRSRPKSTPTLISTTFHSTQYPTPIEAPSPMIDLNAAFETNEIEGRNSFDTPTRSAASRIAKLHSSSHRGNMDPFGTFHKRAESAPMLQPFNRGAVPMQRMGSNPSLADVFDEEEEDEFLAAGKASTGATPEPPMSDRGDEPFMLSKVSSRSSSARVPTQSGLGLSMQGPSDDGIAIVDPEDDPASDQRSSKSTIEAPTLLNAEAKRPTTSPLFFAYPAPPRSQYASSTEGRTTSASMISSPDPDHVSFDNFPRSTRYLGEPHPDFVLRASNEDLPSLTDSLSSSALPRISSSANSRPSVEHRSYSDQRSFSVCVPDRPKTSNSDWKRASLASLNRLIPGSANGSRLKFETTPEPQTTDKEKRKSNRLSKLVSFWRSKEKGTN